MSALALASDRLAERCCQNNDTMEGRGWSGQPKNASRRTRPPNTSPKPWPQSHPAWPVLRSRLTTGWASRSVTKLPETTK